MQALTKQQKLDFSGSSFSISPQILVYLLGPLNCLLVDCGANSAAHVNFPGSQTASTLVKKM